MNYRWSDACLAEICQVYSLYWRREISIDEARQIADGGAEMILVAARSIQEEKAQTPGGSRVVDLNSERLRRTG